MTPMLKGLIRLLGFFTKELNKVRRQPRLMLSLILGPFLILLLFGLGYQATPRLRAVLVIPDALAQEMDVSAIQYAASLTYDVIQVTSDENAAHALLQTRQADVVEIIPADVRERLELGQAAPVEFLYSEINPLNETWIQSLGYAQVNEMNKALLVQTATQVQQEARTNQAWVGQVRQELDALSADSNENDLAQSRDSIQRLRALVNVMIASPLLAAQLTANGQDPEQTKTELTALASDLDAMDASIANHTFAQEQTRLTSVRDRVARFETLLDNFSRMPATVLVSPLVPTYENAQGQALTLATFYAPAVLALILQHIAVTLGALSLVRERLLGAVELFDVAPVSSRQVLLGKYLAYVLFIGILGVVLTVAMSWMQVPFRGDAGAFIGILALLVIASLGIGFLISTVSKSDTQAVQLSMLMLLLSIFFSGFFLPLENFWLPVRALGYAMPITPGILALQDVMLRGTIPAWWLWLLLGGATLVTFLIVNLFAARQLRFAR
jgi:ABC-2 type transport system permease protein